MTIEKQQKLSTAFNTRSSYETIQAADRKNFRFVQLT